MDGVDVDERNWRPPERPRGSPAARTSLTATAFKRFTPLTEPVIPARAKRVTDNLRTRSAIAAKVRVWSGVCQRCVGVTGSFQR
jgi:hypothetical protein